MVRVIFATGLFENLTCFFLSLFFFSLFQGLVKFPWGWGLVLMAKQHHLTNQVPGQMACCPWNKALMGLKIGGAVLCDCRKC